MESIRVDEYLALACWIASAAVLFSKAIHWQPSSSSMSPTRIMARRALYVLAAIFFVALSIKVLCFG